MRVFGLFAASLLVLCLALVSLMIGASDIGLSDLWLDPEKREIFLISRLPRTLALILAGAAMSVSGLIMQLLTQNKFVEPSTAGTVQSAGFGILMITLVFPAAPLWSKMLAASLFALLGTLLFLALLRRVSLRSAVIVPLVGMMLGAVISAVGTFIAVRFEMLQSLAAWNVGDFSGVLRGRYELLWLVAALTGLAYLVADRFVVAGLGREFAVNVGLNYRRVMMIGLCIVSAVTGIVVVVAGALPFLGLIVPNLVSMVFGDNIRRTMPWICLLGSGIVLACDIFGRLVRYPFEIPVGTILGVLGALVFLLVLLRRRAHVQ